MLKGASRFAVALCCLALIIGSSASAQMKTGRAMANFNSAFDVKEEQQFDQIKKVKVILLKTSTPACIYYPGEQPEVTIQVINLTDQPVKVQGKADFYQYATRSIPSDMWQSDVTRLAELKPVPLNVDIAPKGYQNIVIKPQMPETMGGYGLVLDLGEYGRDFLCGLTRGHKPSAERIQFPKQSLDYMKPSILNRLGVQSIRMGWGYVNSNHPTFEQAMADLDAQMKELWENKVTVMLEFGGGRYDAPGATWRTHLNEDGVMRGGKPDLCWMPKDDKDFEEVAYQIACKYGWPRGPITGYMLWNEPWEGSSISGWQADMIRYRTIYKHMGEAAHRAAKDAGVEVLVGGCDSSMNTWDKLFPDGSDEFMPYFDFVSMHYQALHIPTLHPDWQNRTYGRGRVKMWDTESWIANTDDKVAGMVASLRAAGYDKILGIFFGNITTQRSHGLKFYDDFMTPEGKVRQVRPQFSWPVAASVLASQHFIGERNFRTLLFKEGLPWVYVFDGLDNNPNDGTIVVLGDIGTLYSDTHDRMLYRTINSLDEVRQELPLHKQLAGLPADDPKRAELLSTLTAKQSFTGATMTIPVEDDSFGLYDFYGNEMPIQGNEIVIPLDARGFFLRARSQEIGAFADLVAAVQDARIEGLEPLETVAHDMVAPISSKPELKLTLHNILNRPISGTLSVQLGSLSVSYPQQLEFAPFESKDIAVKVTGGKASPDNNYLLSMQFDAGADGTAIHDEMMHVNYIAKRTITVDGKLNDWEGALPETIKSDQAARQTTMEAAWLPFEKFEAGQSGGVVTGYVAYDEDYFYFAAKVADNTPDNGTFRYETIDDSQFFYPETYKDAKGNEYKWPEGVRRYSYRKNPVLPDGSFSRFDNIQIAFNAIPQAQDEWLTHLPGIPNRYITYKCTDYEYALNTVAEEYGGGFEVWRLLVPGMPLKHFYPREPESPYDGPVKNAKMVTVHEGNTRITELAMPWSEIPDVKARLDAGETVKFSFRANNNTGGPLLELAKGRSVSKINTTAMHVHWGESWANEVEFGFEK